MELQQTGNQVVVQGEVNFDNATALLKKFQRLPLEGDEIIINCNKISHANSVVLACLLEFMRIVRKKGKTVKVINLPKNLQSVARISHLEKVL